jgi:tetratricopeptide (TPR) repeat protein
MAQCEYCGRNINFRSKKYYIYPAKRKGSLEITQATIICKDCISKYFTGSDKSELDKRRNALILFAEKNFKEALKVLESVFDKESESDWYSKGNILHNLGDVEEALECYDEALFLDTHYIKAWYRKGHVLLSMNKYMDSAKCFENVVELEGGGNTGRRLTGWGFPALFCCMIGWICTNNELVNKGKSSKEVYETTGMWVNKCHSLLTRPLPIYEDEHGNLKHVTLASPELNEIQFVDYCFANFRKILEAIEPQLVVEFKSLEDFEKEH